MLARITVPLLCSCRRLLRVRPRRESDRERSAARASAGNGRVVARHVSTRPATARPLRDRGHERRRTKRVELNFPSGRTHDFVVLDDAGTKSGAGAMVACSHRRMQNRLLEAHDSVVYDERWSPPPTAGRYTLVAQLHSDNYPVRAARRVRAAVARRHARVSGTP